MKQTIITTMLALVVMTGWAQKFIITFLLAIVAMAGQAKDIIWKNPSAFMGNYIGEFFITQV